MQRLFAIGTHIEAIGDNHDPIEIRARLAARVRELNQTIELIRTTVFNPAPSVRSSDLGTPPIG